MNLTRHSSHDTRHRALALLALALLALAPSLHAQSLSGTNNTNNSLSLNSVIVSGATNIIESSSRQAFLGAGWKNTINSNAPFAFVGSGYLNVIRTNSAYSSIVGGRENSVSGEYSIVGGGIGNSYAGSYGGLFGGLRNSASGTASLIVGGNANSVSNSYSVVMGGRQNTNTGEAAVIIGGTANKAGGFYATVLGGLGNEAMASYSFAAGRRAKATNNGAFVFSDSRDMDFPSTAVNQFLIRAQNGVGINTNNPQGNALFVNGSARISTNLLVDSRLGIGTTNLGTNALSVVGSAAITGNLSVTGTLNGTFSNATFTTLTVNGPITSSSNSISLQPGGTTGFTVGPQLSNSIVLTNNVNPDRTQGVWSYTSRAHNVVAGSASNRVAPGVIGATIAGGGYLLTSNSTGLYTNFNEVSGDFGTVSGGSGNHAGQWMATVAGGWENKAMGYFSTIGGGVENSITDPASAGLSAFILGIGTIAGGELNRIDNTIGGSIGGGYANTIVNTGVFTNQSDFIPWGSTVAGGYYNVISNSDAFTISGGSDNLADNAYHGVIAGGAYNRAVSAGTNIIITYPTIGGGYSNVVSGDFATIPGGWDNEARGMGSFAAGISAKAQHMGTFVWADYLPVPEPPSQPGGPDMFAQSSQLQDNSFASTGDNQFLIRAQGGVGINTNNPGTNALSVSGRTLITGDLQVDGIILSGTNNTTVGLNSVIGGGINNANSGTQSTIAGGSGNAIYFAAVGGSVGGGTANLITNNATNGTISGGEGNTVGGNYAIVGGGFDNGATGVASTVSGGEANVASGAHSTVPGGLSNEVTGVGSFAAGVRAKATNNYSFVWGGDPTVDTESFGAGTYTVRAPEGARFITSAASNTNLTTNNTNPPLGVILTKNSGSWASLSDSNAKTAVTPIDHREILRKVAALPVTSWNYKHDPNRRYIGPMAQDFHAAFGLGFDDKHISTLDTDGVALSAIKGLVEEIRDQDKVLAERDAQIEALQRAVESLRKEVTGQSF